MVVRVRGFLRGVLSGWVELNFNDDVEGIKSGQSLGNSGNQRKDRSKRDNHRPVVIRIGKTAMPCHELDEGRFQNVGGTRRTSGVDCGSLPKSLSHVTQSNVTLVRLL